MLAGKIGYFRPTGFDPRSISGLAAWYDASATSSVTLTGGFVSQWSDLSGNGLHLTQSTEANRPSTTTVNGLRAVDFDGANDHLFTSTQANARTVFNVHVIDVANVAQTIYHTQSGSGLTDLRMHLLYSSANEYRSQSVASGVNQGVSGGARTANQRLTVLTFSGTASTGRLDGASLAGTTLATGSSQLGIWLGIRNISGTLSLPLNGKICEHIIYDRVLSAAEISTVEQYLSAKWAISLAPQASNADAQSWISRVLSNGGTVSTSTATAVNDFCNSIDASGIRDRFYRLNLFAGTGLAACLVPLYRGQSLGGTQFGNATDTNVNFAAGDYVETGATGGLKGNGSSKLLQTGIAGSAISGGDRHLSAYESLPATTTFSPSIGAGTSHNTAVLHQIGPYHALQQMYAVGSSLAAMPTVNPPSAGFWIGTELSTTTASLYRNGVLANQKTGSYGGQADTNYQAFGLQGQSSEVRLGAYSLGLGMTAAQASAYNTAMQAFQTALSRNV
jgi:hypothetical protein